MNFLLRFAASVALVFVLPPLAANAQKIKPKPNKTAAPTAKPVAEPARARLCWLG